MLEGLYKHRSFIWRHAVADVRHRYAGTRGGMVWNVLQPLALLATYAVVFTTLFTPSLPEINVKFSFVLYLCSGFFPFLAFSECVTRGSTAFIDGAGYLKKLPVPEHIFVARTAASAMITLAISFALVIALALIAGLTPKWNWLLLPLPLFMFIASGFGFGLLLATLNVFFNDVAQFTGIMMQVVMWTAPIIYVQTILPPTMQKLLPWHPLVPALTAVRELFLYNRIPAMQTWIAMMAWPVAAIVAGYIVLLTLRSEIRDVI